VMYRNIRYAFFQPAENEMITVRLVDPQALPPWSTWVFRGRPWAGPPSTQPGVSLGGAAALKDRCGLISGPSGALLESPRALPVGPAENEMITVRLAARVPGGRRAMWCRMCPWMERYTGREAAGGVEVIITCGAFGIPASAAPPGGLQQFRYSSSARHARGRTGVVAPAARRPPRSCDPGRGPALDLLLARAHAQTLHFVRGRCSAPRALRAVFRAKWGAFGIPASLARSAPACGRAPLQLRPRRPRGPILDLLLACTSAWPTPGGPHPLALVPPL
jgi:hypothetical protein